MTVDLEAIKAQLARITRANAMMQSWIDYAEAEALEDYKYAEAEALEDYKGRGAFVPNVVCMSYMATVNDVRAQVEAQLGIMS
jgi:hypothetical protein